MTCPTRRPVVPLAMLFLLAACAPAEDAPPAQAEGPEPMATEAVTASVRIVEPPEGGDVQGPNVTVRLEASGVMIHAAGEIIEGTGHHHLYLDADLTDPAMPVPTVPGSIIHMGDGSAAYTFEGVAPGEHRLIAVVADGIHIPLQPWVVDTVTFTVR